MSKHLLEKIWRSVLCLLFVAFIRHHRFQPLRENYEKGYPIRLIPVALHMSAMIKAADRQGTRDQLPCPTKPFSGDLREFPTELVSVCTVYALLFSSIDVYVYMFFWSLGVSLAYHINQHFLLPSAQVWRVSLSVLKLLSAFESFHPSVTVRPVRPVEPVEPVRPVEPVEPVGARKARKARKARRARRACRAHKARRARARWRSEGLFSFFPSPTPPPKVEVW